MINDKKINYKKLDELAQFISGVIANIGKFNEEYQNLNRVEQAMIGNLVVGIDSPYAQSQMSGFVGEDAKCYGLINQLANQHNIYLQQKIQKSAHQQVQLSRATSGTDESQKGIN